MKEERTRGQGTELSHRRMRVASDRFVIRTLESSDVGSDYVAWFDDPVVRSFITWRPGENPAEELRAFVGDHDARSDSLLFGVFDEQGRHVANLKYEPIDLEAGVATLGVLIGDPGWRGRGLFGEAFAATATLISSTLGVGRVMLGVDRRNIAAISAYERSGFTAVAQQGALADQTQDSGGGYLWMECALA